MINSTQAEYSAGVLHVSGTGNLLSLTTDHIFHQAFKHEDPHT